MSQSHHHFVQARQQHPDPSATASGLVVGPAHQSATPRLTHGISALLSGYQPNTQPVSYQVGAPHMTSLSGPQAAQSVDAQSASVTIARGSVWQTEQLRPYLNVNMNQIGISAVGSAAPSNHITVQQGNAQGQATEIYAPALQPVSYNLIHQSAAATSSNNQGPVSYGMHITQAQLLSNNAKSATFSTTTMQNFPQTGRVGASSEQIQAVTSGMSYSESGKRKSSTQQNVEDLSQQDGKLPKTASRTIWNTDRSNADESAPIQTNMALHVSGNFNNAANSSSGFIDSFRSFVESSNQAFPQKKKSGKRAAPVSAMNKGRLNDGPVSQNQAMSGSGFPEQGTPGNENLEKERQSQNFVQEMHAKIFSLSEEGSSTAAAGTESAGQLTSLDMSSNSLASILMKVGRPDGSQDNLTDKASGNSSTETGTIGQGVPDVKKSPHSPPADSSEGDTASSHQHSSKVSSDGSASSGSESESEMSSNNSKKRSKGSGGSTVSKKIKMEEQDKADDAVLGSKASESTNKKKQTKSSKVWAWDKPLVKTSLATLRRTGATFLQHGPCTELGLKVSKCRECRTLAPSPQEGQDMPSIFCRFYAFRRLKYQTAKGTIITAGFSELSDADPDLIEPWLPRFPIEDPQLNKEMAKFILSMVGDKFCELVQQEKEAKSLAGTNGKHPPHPTCWNMTVVWKRAVTGVREMCDVCETTIFNMHWVCSKCGYVICLDCYNAKVKEQDSDKPQGETSRKWQLCTSSRYQHDPTQLLLTQIIPSDALWELGRMIHDVRRKWSIPATCPCGQGGSDSKSSGKLDNSQSSSKKTLNGAGEDGKGKTAAGQQRTKGDPDATSTGPAAPVKKEGAAVKQEKLGGCTSLRELLTKTAGKGRVSLEKKPKPSGSSLNDIIQSVVEKSCRDLDTFKFLHYIPRSGQWWTRELPSVTHSLTETSVLYPDVPHSWLCDGRLLRLHDPRHKGNLQIFQEQWKRGQPVMVSCVHKVMKAGLWRPEFFSRQFGHKTNDLVNCHNGDIIADNPMRNFWDGFESIQNRLTDEYGRDMMLKLKDWPPGDDFAELLPAHFSDLMSSLPLPEYSQRGGKLNLASRLPDFLVRPDLGPKMYNAFGSAMFAKEGTTNLHLDISDAVNVLVYVGVPSDGPGGRTLHEEAAVAAIDEAGCDSITKRRIREVHELPGALWQIYEAHDADKIRDFLNKVAKERGEEIEPNHDAIHDQSWYLDEVLRDRLLREYGVQGYTIIQCLGDSIFIPAGAPHQVRNLHSCIKVAEDFVSPEHLNHCFRMTQEFRQLSETHSNHEDKLQVKNIIYHAVKDSIAVLREHEPDGSP